VYFKRELNQIISRSNFLHSSILPISFAIEKRYCLGKELASKRDLDFVCMMNLNTNPYRKEVQEFLDQYFLNEQLNTYVGMTGERAYGSESYPLETPIYYSKLAGSRIALSMHGAGQDCARYWEILASGALLISQRMTNHVVNEPIDGEHCYYFDSISELEKVLNFVFANPELVERVAKNGSEFSLEYHSSKARAAYFLGGLMSYKVSIYSKLIGLIKILYYNFMVSWQLKRIVAI
jgi:hypothetical protein